MPRVKVARPVAEASSEAVIIRGARMGAAPAVWEADHVVAEAASKALDRLRAAHLARAPLAPVEIAK